MTTGLERPCNICGDPEPGAIWIGDDDVARCDTCRCIERMERSHAHLAKKANAWWEAWGKDTRALADELAYIKATIRNYLRNDVSCCTDCWDAGKQTHHPLERLIENHDG